MGSSFVFTAFTDDPDVASVLDDAGVDRIGPDLEYYGKATRQSGMNLRLSGHEIASLGRIAPYLKQAKLFARLNPLFPGSAEEVEAVLAHGTKVVMVPYFKSAAEPIEILRLVGGRALVVPLVETPESLREIEALADAGFRELFFGLNDLRLARGYATVEPVFGDPLFVGALETARAIGLTYSIGGVARLGDASLPIAPELIYRQLRRFGASGSLISRSFLRPRQDWSHVKDDVAAARAALTAAVAPAELGAGDY